MEAFCGVGLELYVVSEGCADGEESDKEEGRNEMCEHLAGIGTMMRLHLSTSCEGVVQKLWTVVLFRTSIEGRGGHVFGIIHVNRRNSWQGVNFRKGSGQARDSSQAAMTQRITTTLHSSLKGLGQHFERLHSVLGGIP